MKLTLLGTGTSFGVPVVGCTCRVCTSDDPRDQRHRSAALLDLPEGRLLVDAPPELRIHLLREGVDRIDAVWITHPHADHLHGLDDLRIFTTKHRTTITAWLSDAHRAEIENRFPYVFDEAFTVPDGTTKPQIRIEEVHDGRAVDLLGSQFTPIAVPHGQMQSYGFRVGPLGYITDGKSLPPAAIDVLRGVDTLVVNALWWGNPHPTHFNIEEAIEAARLVGARQTFLVHLTHRVLHAELEAELPDGIRPGHDGLVLEFDVEGDQVSAREPASGGAPAARAADDSGGETR